MRDHDDRPATHGRRERLDKRRFVFRVSKRRRLIEHQDGAILQKRPGDSNALPLAAGEKYPTFPDSSVVTFWQSANKIMACATLAAAITASSGVSGAPRRMLLAIVSAKRKLS